MSLSNLISVTFTTDELKQLDAHLLAIETLLQQKGVALTAEQRQEYGRMGNRTENWSQKTQSYMISQPKFTPSFVDAAETERDFAARKALMPRASRVKSIMNQFDDTLLVLGSDIYDSCVAYYRNVKLLAQQNVPGAKAVYDDLSDQFATRSVPKSEVKA